MNYQESLDYIKSLAPTLEKPSLSRIQLYFAHFGDCQNRLPVFHVGGTNGKGSVTTYIATMLSACGHKVGKFTGPHLSRFNERLVIDGVEIDDTSFARVATVVHHQSLAFAESYPQFGPLTWFEFLTAMAVQYFLDCKVTLAVFEVGLGGRFDATNALGNVLISTITNVALDHMHLLGNTEAAIAFEKAGIIKDAPVVTASTGEALVVIEQRAQMQNTPLIVIKTPQGAFGSDLFQTFAADIQNTDEAFVERLQTKIAWAKKEIFTTADLTLTGAYQRLNALTAVISLCASDLTGPDVPGNLAENLSRGLTEARWPGRFEIDSEAGLLLDGAHNPAGARALRLSLDEMFGDKKRAFVFASFENKDLASVLIELLRKGDRVFCPKLEGERPFHKYEDIDSICSRMGVSCFSAADFAQATREATLAIRSGNGFAPLVIVTGSFATIRAAK